ncbi:hypothetical protein Ancab_035648, partial [Ancistrocladus abbreviatus]
MGRKPVKRLWQFGLTVAQQDAWFTCFAEEIYRRILHPGPFISWCFPGALAVSRGFLFCWVDGWDRRTALPLSLLYSRCLFSQPDALTVVFVKGDEELGARCFPFGPDCSWTLPFVKTVFGDAGGGPLRGWCCRL